MKDAPINLPEAAEALLLRAKQALTMSTATIGQRDINTAIVEDIRAYLLAAPSPASPQVPSQEPVAWRSWHDKDGYGFWDTEDEARLYCAPDAEPEPLYAAPQPQAPSATSDDMRDKRIAELEQQNRAILYDYHNGTPCEQIAWAQERDALKASLADARDKALEEAAQMFEKRWPQWDDCANAIRALRANSEK
jgi:hypothetical protein